MNAFVPTNRRCLTYLMAGLMAVFAFAYASPRELQSSSQELVFRNGDALLAATVFIPRGRPVLSGVVVAHGASSGLRSDKIYQHLSETLPAVGVAVLTFDRRGTGASVPASGRFSYDILASDLVAARLALQAQLGSKSKPIGYWGYSQGGWIALLAGNADADAAFVISVSAPITTPDIQMITATRNILRIRGYDESVQDRAVAVREMVDAHARGQIGRDQAQKGLDSIVKEPWFQHIYLSPVINDESSRKWSDDISHDPLVALQNLDAPTLLIYGANDQWIPVPESIARANGIGKQNLTPLVIPGADHALMTSLSAADQIDPSKSSIFNPESHLYFTSMGAWLAANGFADVQPSSP
jgi:pimeloyl-ACP methyl ester carboxylesterase